MAIIGLAILLVLIFCVVGFATTEPPPEEDNSGLIQSILDGLIGLFVPSEEYFQSWWNEISKAVDIKVVGLKGTLSAFTEQFNSLTNVTEKPTISFEIKDDQLFKGSEGIKVDFLETAKPYLDFMRPIINGFVAICLLVYCYRTVTAMFGE